MNRNSNKNQTTRRGETASVQSLNFDQLEQVTGGHVGGMIATPKWIVLESTPGWVVAHGLRAGFEVEVIN